jgi:hypothetical protein
MKLWVTNIGYQQIGLANAADAVALVGILDRAQRIEGYPRRIISGGEPLASMIELTDIAEAPEFAEVEPAPPPEAPKAPEPFDPDNVLF